MKEEVKTWLVSGGYPETALWNELSISFWIFKNFGYRIYVNRDPGKTFSIQIINPSKQPLPGTAEKFSSSADALKGAFFQVYLDIKSKT